MSKRVFMGLLAVIILLPVLSACDKKEEQTAVSDNIMGRGLYSSYEYEEDYEMQRAVAEPYITSAPVPAPSMGSYPEEEMLGDTAGEMPEKRIKTGNLSLDTTDFETVQTQIAELAAGAEGYVESSNQYISGNNLRRADYVLRVPSESFDTVMSALSSLGKVTATGISEQDVTDQYYDISARLSAKEAEEARLLELIDQAENLNDLILLESRLSSVRSDIEYYRSRRTGIDRKASFSTIYLYIAEVTDVYDTDSLWGRISEAFEDSLNSIVVFFQETLVFIVSAAVPFIIIAAVALVGFLVFRRFMKRRGKKE